MDRRTFFKAVVIAAATPTVTAFADTADHVTLATLIELHTRAYEADSNEWRKLHEIDEAADIAGKVPVARKAELRRALGYAEQKQRCQDAKTVVERMEAAIFAYRLSTHDDVLTLARWAHSRLDDCRCYFYQDERAVHAIFWQIANANEMSSAAVPA